MKSVDAFTPALDKRMVRAAFERSAESYDQVAVLQRTVADRLLDHLAPVRLQPRVVVDVGAGTGICLRQLEKRYRHAQVIALDLAEAMLKQARRKAPRFFSRQRFVCADAECLPFGNGSVELLFSNLTLQWCNHLEHTYREFARVVVPGGLLMFSTFGPDTLKELRDSFAEVDGHSHVNSFQDLHDIGDALMASGFRDVVVDAERITMTYRDVMSLMRDLKSLGAHNVTSGRQRGLTGKQRMQAMTRAYEARREAGVLPATYEVIYAHAWVAQPRSVSIPVTALHASGGLCGNETLEP
ncbi:MAG: malonyl-ACP O-methyltransferase BioC [Gammaproteobacteria bacterium]|jgi:malonyl-CoA O-methyltransferase